MRKYLARFFGLLAKSFEEKEREIITQSVDETQYHTGITQEIENQNISINTEKSEKKKPNKTKRLKKNDTKELTGSIFDPRDIMEVMEVPFLALSKNRIRPIIYQSRDGKTKVKVSAHRQHYMASIYDWDIILLISAKMQDIINSKSDIPPRTIIIPRHEILKSLHRHNGKKEEKDLKSSLSRLKSTLIETTIRNESGEYDAGFGFLDSWSYTDRKDVKEIKITLSQWLYDGICRKGSLLKVNHEYFNITSGLKKFLYRTARKHVGNNDFWEFAVERLYEKSGSEQEFKKFKYKLKKVIIDNDIPEYFLEWIEEENKTSVRFTNKRKELTKMLTK